MAPAAGGGAGQVVAQGEAFLIDSLPVPVCRRVRARRCREVRGAEYRGDCAAKREEELAKDLAGILDPVAREHERVVVERAGTAIAVVKPVERPASTRRGARFDPIRPLPAAFTLETAAGPVPALPEPLTWDEIEQRVQEERAERR